MIKYFFLALLFFAACDRDNNQQDINSATTEVEAHQEDTLQSESDIRYQEKSSSGFGFINFLSGFFKWIATIILLLILFTILFFMYRNYRKRMNRLNKSVHSLNEKFKGIENDFNEIQKENRQIKKHLKNKLFPKIENLENSLSELKKRKRVELKNNTTDRKETGKVKISSPDEVQNIKYFSAPDENGRFDNKRALDTPQGRVYYSISYAADSKTGVIDYHQGKLDQSAIDQRDSILKPVCKIRNSEISNPIKINQIKSGEAELVNGIWKINEKIQIEFQ